MLKLWRTRKKKESDIQPDDNMEILGNTAELNRRFNETFSRNLTEGLKKLLEEFEQTEDISSEKSPTNNPAQTNAP